VHLGHQLVLHHALNLAEQAGKKMVVITFANHPLSVLAPERLPRVIDDFASRHQIFQHSGADVLLELSFTKELAALSAAEFLLELQENLAPSILVVGPNNTFGCHGEGTPEYLRLHAAQYGMRAEICPPLVHGGTIVSSTRIRALLAQGELQAAKALLGRSFRITGTIVKGDQRGRLLGYPTANIDLSSQQLALPDGVYAVQVKLEGKQYYGMASVGNNPTFGLAEKRLEVNIFDYQGDAYGRQLVVEFVQQLRQMKAFNGIEALKLQLRQDKNDCYKIFGLH